MDTVESLAQAVIVAYQEYLDTRVYRGFLDHQDIAEKAVTAVYPDCQDIPGFREFLVTRVSQVILEYLGVVASPVYQDTQALVASLESLDIQASQEFQVIRERRE